MIFRHSAQLEVVEGDLACPAVIGRNLARLRSRIDTLIHCAAETSFLGGRETKDTSARIPGRPLARLNIVPVEYVAAAIAQLTSDPQASGKTFHLVSANPPTQKMLLEMLSARLGLRGLKLVDATEELRNASPFERRVARMLAPYRDYLEHDVRFDDSNARRLLDDRDLDRPIIDSRQIDRLIELAWSPNQERVSTKCRVELCENARDK